MKALIKQQLKALEITQESFCEKHGYDKTNFPKKINKIIRDIDKAKEVLSKLDIEILIASRAKERWQKYKNGQIAIHYPFCNKK